MQLAESTSLDQKGMTSYIIAIIFFSFGSKCLGKSQARSDSLRAVKLLQLCVPGLASTEAENVSSRHPHTECTCTPHVHVCTADIN